MFAYLEHNRYRKIWEISVDELKGILNCDKVDTYKEFKHFNNLILKKIQKELLEKTECKYDYEPIKKGRSIVAVKFTVQTLAHVDFTEPSENNINVEQVEDNELWQEPLKNFNFSKEQYDELFSLLVTVPESKLPPSSACYSIELMRFHYLDQKAKEIKRRDKQKKIKNKYSYLLKMIKQDAI